MNTDSNEPSASEPQQEKTRKGWLTKWHETPLYLRIIGALVLGVITGAILGASGERGYRIAESLAIPSRLILRLLGALAPALILFAIVHALMGMKAQGHQGLRLVWLLLLNTLVAITIGLAVANIIRPGDWARITTPQAAQEEQKKGTDPLTQFLDNVPKSLLGPLGDDGKIIGVIFMAVAFGVALRKVRDQRVQTVSDVVEVGFEALIVILHWVIDIVPLAVFAIVASIIGTKGFSDFVALGAFVLAVLLALFLQAVYYLVRIKFGSWVRPFDLLRKTSDALLMAFSTASSTVTMPVTYERLRYRVGLRERSASMGALVGANFNNDGTALYEAMSALFISQMLGMRLSFTQQLIVVLTSIVASVGAAGIPEAGLVTMTLVFNAVGLPPTYIAILLTVDWFLDRCRTMINVMGDMNVSCLLDGKVPESRAPAESAATAVPATG